MVSRWQPLAAEASPIFKTNSPLDPVVTTDYTIVATDYHPLLRRFVIGMKTFWLWSWAGLLALCLPFASAAEDTPANARQTWQILDYVAVDYAGAVKNRTVVDQAEYAEMREFVATVLAQVQNFPPTPQQPALVNEANQLIAAVEAKEEPDQVADMAHRFADALLKSYPISSVPASVPNLRQAASRYDEQCAACHGQTGQGNGPAATNLNPPPIAFADSSRAAKRTPFALYEAISQGIDGTSMASYSALPEQDRWALAFYVGSFAYSPQMRANGEKLWRNQPEIRQRLPTLEALTRSSESELAKHMDRSQAQAITAYLRSSPESITSSATAGRSAPFDLARQQMNASVSAYEAHDIAQARALALSAYLDGVEPAEPTLAARDRDLMRQLETAMGRFRAQLNESAPIDSVRSQSAQVEALLGRADTVMQDVQTDATTAFLGSFTVLLREGLEAMLIVIGMIAFLRKAKRPEVLRYVHAGWLSALVAGGLTWSIATYIVEISGASREVTEGLSAVFAALVLLSVGIWMHQKSLAGRWQHYLKAKMSAALTRRSAMFLFLLAFVAVYREVFETILFFIAMWSEANSTAIIGGLIAGVVVLAGVAYWMLRISRRLPIGQFFAVSSILIAVLAIVLIGKGVAALQEAGWIAQGFVALPRIEWLGIYPSWQSILAQLSVLTIAAVGFVTNSRSARDETSNQ